MLPKTPLVSFAALGLGLAAAVAPVLASDDDPLAPMRACPAIADPLQRVACFDAGFNEADRKLGNDRVEKAKRTKEEFGLTGPQIEDRREAERKAQAPEQAQAAPAAPVRTPAPAATQEEQDRLVAKLQEVLTDGTGHKVFLLDNGQLWREMPGSTYRGILRGGFGVEIRKSMLGGYRMSITGRTGFYAVQRVR
jgi:hypothetical protein